MRRCHVLQSVGLRIASHATHTTTELHRVGGDEVFAFADVAQCHVVMLRVGEIERETAEIHPCATAHLLVNLELGFLSAVHDGIFGSVGAVGETFVGYVYGILANRQRVRGITEFAYLFAAHWRYQIATFLKRILAFQQHFVVVLSPTSAFAFYPLPHRLNGVPDDARVMGCSFA